MTTLQPFLKIDRKTEALRRIVSVLLQGIALHSFQIDEAAREAFQSPVRSLRARIEAVDHEDSALLLAGAAIRLLEENTAAAESQLVARQNEFERSLALIADALLEITGSSEPAMLHIKEVERDLASARSLTDLKSARSRLATAVDSIREKAAAACETHDVGAGEIDGVTGLPDFVHGATAIAEIWNHRKDYYAALFAAERLATINMRFGFGAGDQMMQVMAQQVSSYATSGDQLFRWRGPCVLMLMRRRAPEAHVAAEVSRIAVSRQELALMSREREAIVSVSTSWRLFPLGTASSAEAVIGELNDHAASRTTYA